MLLQQGTSATQGLDVSVVIPVCNEQENVLPLAREIHAALLGGNRFETIFVDDGSTDGTADAVRSARADGMPEIRLIRHSVRSAQSAAVATGVREARAPWIATLDGDGQNDPADIPKLLDGPAFLVTSLASKLVLGIFATLLVLWFSRQREFRADAGSARLAGREGMIAALESLRRYAGGRSDLPEGLSAFGIAGGGGRFARWFASHPPLEQRIERLRNAA